jgi:hypothetical protein
MDYARLRAEGLELLGRLAGGQWTDFNTHDPGITILEQLCYALTDLGYRCDFPMADLLAASPDAGLPGPNAILTGDPVTLADLSYWVLDDPSLDNAWVGPAEERELDFFYHEASGQLALQPDPGALETTPVALRGLFQVAVQANDQSTGDRDLERATRRLHAARLLGCDYARVERLGIQPVTIKAHIEVSALDDPTEVLADIVEGIEDLLAPAPRFASLAEARARGLTLDRIFEGPPLARGIAGPWPEPPRTVYASDLIHAITDCPQVRAVRSLSPTSIALPPGTMGRLAPDSTLVLRRAGLPIPADLTEARQRVATRREARRQAASDLSALTPRPGRDRHIARYRTLQRQLPAAYGLGPLGLAATAPPERQAQARQLAVYLLIFDQLLANQLAQLAHAHRLLSPAADGIRSYFAQPVDDPPLALLDLWDLGPEPDPMRVQAWLDDLVEQDGLGRDRRQRFLNHLLARFAERLEDYTETLSTDPAAAGTDPLDRRRAFLQDYPRLSGGRGTGWDLSADALSPLVQRLRLKLGVPGLRFDLVEHILLRPLPEDGNQRDPDGSAPVPLLTGVDGPDPWSLRVSFVFETPDPRGREEGWLQRLQSLVSQTLLAEAPAHLALHLHWLDGEGEETWSAFQAVWEAFRMRLRAYRWPLQGAAPRTPTPDPQLAQLRLRDARDRLLELLGLGRPYPLRDLPWTQYLIVPPGSAAAVTLGYSQRGVIYGLCDTGGNPVLLEGKPIEAPGNDGLLALPTPSIQVDVTYRVRATKQEPAGTDQPRPEPRQTWLRGEVRIEEGVDPRLAVEILGLPLLDPRIDPPAPLTAPIADARLADYGVPVSVAVYASQEGVVYELRDQAQPDRPLAGTPSVVGTSGDIHLTLLATEDLDLRVYGSRKVGDPERPETRAALLDRVLPLRVRANPGLPVRLAAPVVAHGTAAALQLDQPQTSVTYQAWQRPVQDREVVFENLLATDTIDVAGDQERVVRILRPPVSSPWQALLGFSLVGPARPSTDQALTLDLGRGERDLLLLVEATKQHRRAPVGHPDDTLVPSSVPLTQALALLVRPDHTRPLGLHIPVAGQSVTGPWGLGDGQPGVYYELRLADRAIARPAYFHQQDDQDSSLNKGLDQLRVEVDLAIPRDPPQASSDPAADPSKISPSLPLLDAAPIPLGSELQVLARKAMTGLTAPLAHTLLLAPGPAINTEPAQVAPGLAVQVTVAASVPGERYTLLRDGLPVGEPREGTGAALTWDSGPLEGTTALVVAVQRAAGEHLPLELRIPVPVTLA